VSGPGNDTLTGDDGDDTIIDLGGYNTIKGDSGNDCLAVYNDTTSSLAGGDAGLTTAAGGTSTNSETSLPTCPSISSLPALCHLP